jgi:protein-tyrosine phosphatase
VALSAAEAASLDKAKRMIDYNRIQPWLLVGAFLESAHEVEILQRRENVSAVLNLQTDEDFEEVRFFDEHPEILYADTDVKVCRFPIRDFDKAHLQQRLPECVAVLRRLLNEGHTVYLHCSAGINRSPTVAAAYLHWCLGWDLDTAVQHVEQRRNCSPNVDAIRQAKWPPPSTPPEADSPPAREAT